MKIIFERIRFFYFPIVHYYLWKKGDIHVFDFKLNLKKIGWMRSLLNRGRVRRIYVSNAGEEHGTAIDQTNILYDKLPEKKISEAVARFHRNGEIHLAFKKFLVEEVFHALHLHQYLRREETAAGGGEKIYFIPDNYLSFKKGILKYGDLRLDPLQKIRIPRGILYLASFLRLAEKISTLAAGFGYLLLRLALLCLGKIVGFFAPPPKHFKHAVAVYQAFETKFGNKRAFDFLVDEKHITKNNCVFLFFKSPDPKTMELCRKKKYHWTTVKSLTGLRGFLKTNVSWREIFSLWRLLLRFPFFQHRFLWSSLTFLRVLSVHINYLLIRSRVTFDNYVYMNQESGNQIAMNVLMNRDDVQVWHYAVSPYMGHFFVKTGDRFDHKRLWLMAYLNGDHYLSMNQDLVDFQKIHSQHIGNYHVIGNIYSEMVCEEMRAPENRDLGREYFGRQWKEGKKIVSFYDTAFIDIGNCPTTLDDGIAFYQDILGMLTENEDLLIIIKPHKDEKFYVAPDALWASLSKGKKLVGLWDVLKRDPRVYWAGDRGDSPKVLAASDLVVTHCLSAPTGEALGARKRAFWYESGNNHRVNIYSHIPGLVVHGYEALRKRAEELLYDTKPEDYEAYLHQYILGKVEYNLDGLGLTRFRELLHGSTS